MSEERLSRCRYDGDEVLSVIKRDKVKAAEDKAATPDADRAKRLWFGDTPLILLEGGDVLVVRMTDESLKLYKYHRQRGCSGLFMDATEGLVRLCAVLGWWPALRSSPSKCVAAGQVLRLPCLPVTNLPMLPADR